MAFEARFEHPRGSSALEDRHKHKNESVDQSRKKKTRAGDDYIRSERLNGEVITAAGTQIKIGFSESVCGRPKLHHEELKLSRNYHLIISTCAITAV